MLRDKYPRDVGSRRCGIRVATLLEVWAIFPWLAPQRWEFRANGGDKGLTAMLLNACSCCKFLPARRRPFISSHVSGLTARQPSSCLLRTEDDYENNSKCRGPRSRRLTSCAAFKSW